MNALVFGGGVKRVSVVLIIVLVCIALGSQNVFAEHLSEKERRVYLEEIEAEYKSGTLSAENYRAKLEFLEDHDGEKDPKDRPKEPWSITMAILGTVIPIAVVGAFFIARIRRRNHQQEQAGIPSEGFPLQGEVEADGKPKGMGEIFRDKNRDNLTQALNSIGIQATMLQRGRAEEKIREKTMGIFGSSLGIIQIDGDQIPWINVVRLRRQDKNGPAKYRAVFGILDPTLPSEHHPLEIKTVRKKSFPVFGKVIDVHWEARDALAPLVNVFSQDEDIINFVKDIGDIAVHTHPRQFQGWTVEVTTLHKVFIPVVIDQWNVLHKIADYLIASPRD